MGYTRDLVTGIAALLADAGLGVYDPNGIYTEGTHAITYGSMPEEPTRVICLTPYEVEDTGHTDVITGMQVRMREGLDPTAVLDLADLVRDELHCRERLQFGATRVGLIWRESQGPMGQDPHGREEISATYYIRATRPSPYVHE